MCDVETARCVPLRPRCACPHPCSCPLQRGGRNQSGGRYGWRGWRGKARAEGGKLLRFTARRTRGTHTQKPSSHLNTHGKWHLHTSHLRQIHHCLNPHTQIPAHPLSLGVSWYLANCFQEIVGNRMIRGRTQAEIVGKKGTRRTSQRSSSRRKRRRRKRRRGGEG